MAVKSESAAQLIARPSSHRILPTPVTVSGISFASTGWLGLAFVCTASLVIAASFPYWTINTSPQSSVKAIRIKLGLFYFCYTPGTGNNPDIMEECHPYVGNITTSTSLDPVDLDDIVFLFTSSVIYLVGVLLLMISLLVGMVAYCKPRIKKQSVFLVAFVIQLFACKFAWFGDITTAGHCVLCAYMYNESTHYIYV